MVTMVAVCVCRCVCSVCICVCVYMCMCVCVCATESSEVLDDAEAEAALQLHDLIHHHVPLDVAEFVL